MCHKSVLPKRAWYMSVMQVDTLQQRCTATDAQAVQLQQQLTNLHADKALLGARLHDGSLDMVKGQLIQQLGPHPAESTQAAGEAGAASQHTSSQVQSLQDQLALQQQAQASERERLSMEAAQSRLLCKARARQVNTLEVQYQAQVSEMTLAIHRKSCETAAQLMNHNSVEGMLLNACQISFPWCCVQMRLMHTGPPAQLRHIGHTSPSCQAGWATALEHSHSTCNPACSNGCVKGLIIYTCDLNSFTCSNLLALVLHQSSAPNTTG